MRDARAHVERQLIGGDRVQVAAALAVLAADQGIGRAREKMGRVPGRLEFKALDLGLAPVEIRRKSVLAEGAAFDQILRAC